jgi:hypothetical protein
MNAHSNLRFLTLVTSMSVIFASPLFAADRPEMTEVLSTPHLELSSARFSHLSDPAQNDWQKQYDVAKSRKNGGKKKMFIGLALDGAGVATVFLAANNCVNKVTDLYGDCSGNVSAMLLGGLMGAGGGITFVWGLIEYIDGNGDVRGLERQRPAGQNQAAAVPLGDHQAVAFTVGKRSSVGYRVSW